MRPTMTADSSATSREVPGADGWEMVTEYAEPTGGVVAAYRVHLPWCVLAVPDPRAVDSKFGRAAGRLLGTVVGHLMFDGLRADYLVNAHPNRPVLACPRCCPALTAAVEVLRRHEVDRWDGLPLVAEVLAAGDAWPDRMAALDTLLALQSGITHQHLFH